MSFLLTLCKLEIDIFTEDIHFLTRKNFIKNQQVKKPQGKAILPKPLKKN